MRLILKRTWKTNKSVIGILYAYNDSDLDNSIFRCFTLEDIERPIKVPKETAIPLGTYDVDFTWSPKFDRSVLMLQNVPNFDRIYLHEGTKAEDTYGCILLGLIRREDAIENSKPCVNSIEQLAREAKSRKEKITIIIQ